MNEQTRLLSALTLFVAVVLASIALFVLDNKNLARVLFAVVLVVGYGYIALRWRASR